MARTIPVTVEVDGEEREIQVDPSEHGLLPENEVRDGYMPRDRFQEELNRRLQGKYGLEEIVEDEEALETLRSRRPDLFRSEDDGGEPEGLTEEDLDRYREEWRSQEVDPMQDRVEELESENERLRREQLKRVALEAFDEVGIRKGLRPLVLEYYANADRVGFHDEEGDWFLRDGEHFLPSASEENRYVTIREDLARKRKEGDYADWFEATTREGAGFGGSGEGGGRRQINSKADIKTRADRVAYIKEHGIEAYESLPDEA